VELDGSIVWGESYTGHVRRRRRDGAIEDLGRLPGNNPTRTEVDHGNLW
jgi:gluconolactonase